MSYSGRVLIIIFALLAGTGVRAQPADTLPQFDISRNCHAESRDNVAVGQSLNTCMNDEKIAQDQLSKQWSSYPVDWRKTCAQESATGDTQSYVELRTCLEMTREAKRERRP